MYLNNLSTDLLYFIRDHCKALGIRLKIIIIFIIILVAVAVVVAV